MLNAIGLENVGLEAFIRDKLPSLESAPSAVVVNLFGEREEDYVELASRLSAFDRDPTRRSGALPAEGRVPKVIDAFELNISCPNVKAGGVELGLNPTVAGDLVRAVRDVTTLPLWVKLSPNAGEGIVEVAQAVAQSGADAITLVNTFTGMVIDIETRRPVLANRTGGLSGPAIRPLALRMVERVAAAVDLPVVGLGGISCAEDAIAFLLVGACAVQVGTAIFRDPSAPRKISDGIERYLDRHGFDSVESLVGALIG